MKKILILCAAAAMSLGVMSSCDKSSGNSEAANGLGDSIAQAYGEVNGKMLIDYLAQMPDSEKANYSKEDILRGIKDVLMLDSTQQGYVVGLQVGLSIDQMVNQIKESSGVVIDRKVLYDNIVSASKADSVSGPDMTAAQGRFQELMTRVQAMMMAKQQADMAARQKAAAESPEAKANAEAGKKFMADLKAKDSAVKETGDGLMYKVVKEGNGASPAAGSTVKVIYTGKLIDGTEFDSSKGEAVEMPMDGLIPGFSEGLKLMKKGGKYTLYIPAELAYGAQETAGGKIKPMSTLVFDVELVDFTAPAK